MGEKAYSPTFYETLHTDVGAIRNIMPFITKHCLDMHHIDAWKCLTAAY